MIFDEDFTNDALTMSVMMIKNEMAVNGVKQMKEHGREVRMTYYQKKKSDCSAVDSTRRDELFQML